MSRYSAKSIAILGTRGIPAAHGGFETFAEELSLYLVRRGWKVTVYCQEEGRGKIQHEVWEDVNLVKVPVAVQGALGTVLFDWLSMREAVKAKVPVLTLGYNTALFALFYRFNGITNLFNMDGLEWQRDKWNTFEKLWLLINERLGTILGDHLIADHPEIMSHLQRFAPEHKITMIPYGAAVVDNADLALLKSFGLEKDSFALLVARQEPENSILEIIKAFSVRPRGIKLVVLGEHDLSKKYHKDIHAAAGNEVIFTGSIYDRETLHSLRYYCRVYIHGHSVGGSNPSLIEALGAGSPVIALDNRFNRWVAGEETSFFKDQESCDTCLNEILEDRERLAAMRVASRERHAKMFSWTEILEQYEALLTARCLYKERI